MHLTINQKTIEVNFSDNEKAQINGVEVSYSVVESASGKFHLLLDNGSYNIQLLERKNNKGELTLSVNEVEILLRIKNPVEEALEKMGINLGAYTQIKELKAPMPGLVLKIVVIAGDIVLKGDPLIVLEAMKMENVIKSPTDGTIDIVKVSIGDKVDKNQILIQFS